jgi:hypothetical protein
MTLEQFGGAVCELLRAEMPTVTDPDGDVMPAVFSPIPSGVGKIPIPPEFYANRATKDMLAAAIAARARQERPSMLAISHTAYYVVSDTTELTEEQLRDLAANRVPRGMVAPMEHPDRIETLQVVAFDSRRTLAWASEIKRDGRTAPVFGEWEAFDQMGGGLMLEPIQEAMRG